jgi:hypothetical protein
MKEVEFRRFSISFSIMILVIVVGYLVSPNEVATTGAKIKLDPIIGNMATSGKITSYSNYNESLDNSTFCSNNTNPTNNNSISKSYVGGEMINTYRYTNYSIMRVIYQASRKIKILEALNDSSHYNVQATNLSNDISNQLSKTNVLFIPDFSTEDIYIENKSEFATYLLDWVSNGHLLIVSDIDLINSVLSEEFGITRIAKIDSISENQSSNISILPSTTFNPNNYNIEVPVNGSLYGFNLETSSNCYPIAKYIESSEDMSVPVGVIGSYGRGFYLAMGFEIANVISLKAQRILRDSLLEFLNLYSVIKFSIRTDTIQIQNLKSPHLHPLSSDDLILNEMQTIAEKFCKMGFNVYHNNLLYNDYENGFFGSLSIQSPLALFTETFKTSITIEHSISTKISLMRPFTIPMFAASTFSDIVMKTRPRLYWPSGWEPPNDLSYYHLAPNKDAVDDMGADQWTPGSVEEIVEADKGRSYGYDGYGIKVALIDTGFSRNRGANPVVPGYPTTNGYHPYYEEFYSDLLESRFTGYDTGEGVHWYQDGVGEGSGHGTAITSNLVSVAPGIELMFIDWEEKEDALDIVLSEEADVVSISWGYPGADGSEPELVELRSRIRQAAENGIIVACAAGNGQLPGYPGVDPCVVSVGGVYVDSSGNLQASNYATSGEISNRRVPDLCGVVGQQPSGILIEMPTEPSSWIDDFYAWSDETEFHDGWVVCSGTSSAAPAVAGLAAILKQIEPSMNVGRFKHIAMTTCTDVVTGQTYPGDSATPGFDDATGAGLINVYRAVRTMILFQDNTYLPQTVPEGHNVNFLKYSGQHGTSYRVDTCGYVNDRSFNFFGFFAARQAPVMANPYDGINIKGWFRQDDGFEGVYEYLQPGRRLLKAYIVSVDGLQILKKITILDHNDGTDWTYIDRDIDCSSDWGLVRLAFGRPDWWNKDWSLVAEWADVQIKSFNYWSPKTIPDDKPYHWGSSTAPEAHMGVTYHIDTDFSGQSGYYFFGYVDSLSFHITSTTVITIRGWFRQYDTFSGPYEYLRPGRRYLKFYIIDTSFSQIAKSYRILDWYDGEDWVYRHIEFEPTGINTGYYKFAFGRRDVWLTNWELTAEWCTVQIELG